MDLTQISSKTQIRFYGEDGQAAQYNSTLTKDKESDNRWPHKENIVISVEDDYNPDNLIATNARKADTPLVFFDEALDIGIRPFYSSANVRISVTYKAVDKNEAERWRNNLRYRFSAGRDINLHDLTFSYHLPDESIMILKELHRLREAVAGYGESFNEWFTKHVTNRASIVTNQSGTHGVWVIAEKQGRVQGIFDFSGTPEKASKEDEPNLWATTFTYTFTYDKPIEVEMQYPLVVHQQLVPAKYRYDKTKKIQPYQTTLHTLAQSMIGLSQFEDVYQTLVAQGNKGINIPEYDNFHPKTVTAGTVKVMTVNTTITPEDKRTLFSLDQLGDFNLRQEVIDFIKSSEYPYMTKLYESVFQLTPYVGMNLTRQDLLSVDQTSKVSAVVDLNLRHSYHVRLGLVANLYLLTPDALRRLGANPFVAKLVIDAINQAIKGLGKCKDIPYRFVPVELVKSLGLDYAGSHGGATVVTGDTQGYGTYGNYGFQMGLVETLFVSTHSLSELIKSKSK